MTDELVPGGFLVLWTWHAIDWVVQYSNPYVSSYRSSPSLYIYQSRLVQGFRVHSTYFFTGFTDTKGEDDVTEERASDTYVPLKGYWSTVSFSSNIGSNVYQDVLYIRDGSSPVDVSRHLGKRPRRNSLSPLLFRRDTRLETHHVGQHVKRTFTDLYRPTR